MANLPQEIIDQIVVAVASGNVSHSLSLHDRHALCDEERRSLWGRFVHADLHTGQHGDDSYCATYPGSSAAIATTLRNLRLVSRAVNRSVQNTLRRLQVLTVDMDRLDSVAHATDFCRQPPTTSLLPQSLLILAGQKTLRPVRRLYFFPRNDSGWDITQERQWDFLAEYKDEPDDSSLSEGDCHWPPKHLRSGKGTAESTDDLPKDVTGGGLSMQDKNALLLDFIEACGAAKLAAARSGNSSALKSLTLAFPEASSCLTGGRHAAGCYDLKVLESTLHVFRQQLFSFNQVPGRYICEDLVDLYLQLPCTQHFGFLFASDGSDDRQEEQAGGALFPRLKHLFIQLTDATGPSGSEEYVSNEYGFNYLDLDAVDGTMTDPSVSRYAPSNLQMHWPNRDHQDDLWRFIASCRSIESLYVGATHYLDLKRLVAIIQDDDDHQDNTDNDSAGQREAGIESADKKHGEQQRDWTKTGLKKLGLSRIYTDIDSLVYLLNPSCEAEHSEAPDNQDRAYDRILSTYTLRTASPIQRLNLDNVKVYDDGGEWAELFRFLLPQQGCPDLDFFGLRYLSYFSDHEHSTHAETLSEDTSTIWTDSEDDIQALGELAEGRPRLLMQGVFYDFFVPARQIIGQETDF